MTEVQLSKTLSLKSSHHNNSSDAIKYTEKLQHITGLC